MKKEEDIKDDKEPKATDDTKQQKNDGDADDGVHVTEEYQKQAHALIGGANKHQVAHVRSRVSDREDELRNAEMAKEKSNKPSPAKEFDATDSPGY